MEAVRKPLQGTFNIIRFNWPFYILALALIALLLSAPVIVPHFRVYFYVAAAFIVLPMIISLIVSWLIYDHSNIYTLPWLEQLRKNPHDKIININAGFDETSHIIKTKVPHNHFYVFDFYDPLKHTEASIRRARRVYPSHPDTKLINTKKLPLPSDCIDKIFLFFTAHEIRNKKEKVDFFKELSRILKPDGTIVVTEHLRDIPNLLAYNVGFFHFYSKKTWLDTFSSSGLIITQKIKTTAFVTTFILTKHGTTS